MARKQKTGSKFDIGAAKGEPDSSPKRKWRLSVQTGERRTNPDGSLGSYLAHQETFTGTAGQANDRLDVIALEIEQRKRARLPDQRTVALMMQDYIPFFTDRRSVNTTRTYMTYIEKRIIPGIGDQLIHELTPRSLDDWYQSLINEGLAPSSVRQINAILSGALKQEQRSGRIQQNVASLAERPPLPNETKPMITVAQLAAIKASATNTSSLHRFIVDLLVGTGCRRAEIAGLHWDDIDSEKLTATIKRTIGVTDDRDRIAMPTKNRTTRVIPITAELGEQLKQYRREDTDWVLAAPDGGPMKPDQIGEMFRQIIKRTPSAKGVRMHDLRHFYGSSLYQAGVSLVEVSHLMGHSTPNVTAKIYLHSSESALDNARAKLDEISKGLQP